ncbi:riboflavin kinase [Candidatus Nomurabacteria bacterium]|nr:riboflavin kinase [Candidatus Nomurabacteria bacterium]
MKAIKISGVVVRGERYGKKLGFPTVNLEVLPPSEEKEGIYAGTAILDNQEYKAGIVIGPGEKVEAHLIGYDGDAYGKEATLTIKKFLREFKKFETRAN